MPARADGHGGHAVARAADAAAVGQLRRVVVHLQPRVVPQRRVRVGGRVARHQLVAGGVRRAWVRARVRDRDRVRVKVRARARVTPTP